MSSSFSRAMLTKPEASRSSIRNVFFSVFFESNEAGSNVAIKNYV